MKSIVTLILMSLPMLSFCQSKSSIDVMFGGHSTFRNLSENSGLDIIIVSRKANEIPVFSWSTGLHFNRRLSERWYLRTGVLLSAMDYKSRKLTEFTWGDQVDSSFMYDPTIPTRSPRGDVGAKYLSETVRRYSPCAATRIQIK